MGYTTLFDIHESFTPFYTRNTLRTSMRKSQGGSLRRPKEFGNHQSPAFNYSFHSVKGHSSRSSITSLRYIIALGNGWKLFARAGEFRGEKVFDTATSLAEHFVAQRLMWPEGGS